MEEEREREREREREKKKSNKRIPTSFYNKLSSMKVHFSKFYQTFYFKVSVGHALRSHKFAFLNFSSFFFFFFFFFFYMNSHMYSKNPTLRNSEKSVNLIDLPVKKKKKKYRFLLMVLAGWMKVFLIKITGVGRKYGQNPYNSFYFLLPIFFLITC
jgi:hypothetical protein